MTVTLRLLSVTCLSLEVRRGMCVKGQRSLHTRVLQVKETSAICFSSFSFLKVYFSWRSHSWNVPWTPGHVGFEANPLVKSRHGFEDDTSGRRRICMLFQTAEHDFQMAASARVSARENLEVEEYLHIVSSQLVDGNMGCFMVREDAVVTTGTFIHFHCYSSSNFSLSLPLCPCSLYRQPQIAQDLISSLSLSSHSLVAVSTGDTLTHIRCHYISRQAAFSSDFDSWLII